MGKTSGSKANNMKWWHLSLFGVGCTIGTGFFLGSSIAINTAGPAVLIAFILAASGTYLVFDALAKMTAADPQEGAFRSYAKKAYGRWAGFSVGWVYWCSEMLITGSQMTALSIFSQFWFPNIPLWVFATSYAILGLLMVLIGVNGLNRMENLFAVIKISAIFMFLIIAAAALFGLFQGSSETAVPGSLKEFFPRGLTGLWASLLFAFYAFGGIEVMGLMASKLRNPKEAPKSGKVMILLLSFIYILAIGLAVLMVSWRTFKANESPFVIALKNYDLPFIPHVFNAALIIAGFSTMAAALFGVTTILVTLAKDGDAPAFFAKQGKLSVPAPALGLTAGGVLISIIFSLVMPERVYEYITTGAGIMLLYNWFFILLSARRLIHLNSIDKIKHFIGMILILLAVSGALFDKTSRPGFLISMSFVIIIGLITLKMRSVWKKGTKKDTLFTRYKP